MSVICLILIYQILLKVLGYGRRMITYNCTSDFFHDQEFNFHLGGPTLGTSSHDVAVSRFCCANFHEVVPIFIELPNFRGSKDANVRSTPHPVTVTTRIITFLVGNPYKPSFATVTGWGVDPMQIYGDLEGFPLQYWDPRKLPKIGWFGLMFLLFSGGFWCIVWVGGNHDPPVVLVLS